MTGRAAARGVAVLHATLGTALLVHPVTIASLAHGRPADRATIRFVRLLGTRHLAQAAIGVAAPAWLTAGRGAVIDAVHAATVLPLLAGPSHRRAAAHNLVIAAALAGLEAVVGHRHGRSDGRVRSAPSVIDESSRAGSSRKQNP